MVDPGEVCWASEAGGLGPEDLPVSVVGEEALSSRLELVPDLVDEG